MQKRRFSRFEWKNGEKTADVRSLFDGVIEGTLLWHVRHFRLWHKEQNATGVYMPEYGGSAVWRFIDSCGGYPTCCGRLRY